MIFVQNKTKQKKPTAVTEENEPFVQYSTVLKKIN